MNARERFQNVMNYKPVDRLPVLALEPYEESVICRWRNEGLPENQSPEEFLHMDRRVCVPLYLGPIPAFPERVISEDDEYIVCTDWLNTTVRRRKEAPTMYYGHIDHPVKTREDWKNYKQRFVPTLSERLPGDWESAWIKRLNESEDPVGLNLYPFFFRLGFYALGMERFLTAFHEEPELIHDMFSFWTDFTLALLQPLLSAVKIDYVVFAEDLAYKTAPHISPRVYTEFWLPYQDRIVRMLQDRKVPLIGLWSSGNVEPLLPLLLEHGINCTWPLERQARGMDPCGLRQRFGRELRMGGNLAKEALIAGPDAIDREIERLMPMVREGGFLPALDDMVPEEVPFAHYRYLVDKLRTIRL